MISNRVKAQQEIALFSRAFGKYIVFHDYFAKQRKKAALICKIFIFFQINN